MSKIGIFSGTFNPVHNGHIMLASFLANNTFLDQVWFNPTPDSTFKEHKDGLIPYEYRKMFLNQVCDNLKNVSVTDIEKYLPSPHYTINTLTALTEKYGNHGLNTFYPIFGADNVEKIETFHDYKRILENYEIIVLPREGGDISHVRFTYGSAKFYVIGDAPMCGLSSTFVRKQFLENKDVRAYVPAIVANNLKMIPKYL